NDKLDRVLTRLDSIDKKIDQVAQNRVAARPQAPPEPDPKATYAVAIDGDTPKGPATAKVTIVEAADFACPFCARAGGTIDELQKQYGNELRVVFKHYIIHPQTATTPALAACAANMQGKFWEFSKQVWSSAWDTANGPRMRDVQLLNEDNMMK